MRRLRKSIFLVLLILLLLNISIIIKKWQSENLLTRLKTKAGNSLVIGVHEIYIELETLVKNYTFEAR